MSDLLLAIDTSTTWAGIAVYDGRLRLELNWVAERHHSEQLVPEIERSLKLLGISRADLAALAVARGPGSYTGVRVGITVARVMGFALSIPVVGVNSLEVLAYEHRVSGLPVRAVLDAGRGRVATALYRAQGDSFARIGALQSVSDEEIAGLVTERTLVCGDLSAAAIDACTTAQTGDQIVLASPSAGVRRAANLAEIAWQRWRSQDPTALETEPVYVTRDNA